jgi:hypothetical protein
MKQRLLLCAILWGVFGGWEILARLCHPSLNVITRDQVTVLLASWALLRIELRKTRAREASAMLREGSGEVS